MRAWDAQGRVHPKVWSPPRELLERADAVILSDSDHACLLQIGTTIVDTVIKNGKVVVESGRLVKR